MDLPQHTKLQTGDDDDLHTPLIDAKSQRFTKAEVVEELKKQLWLAGPLVSFNVLTYMWQVVSVMFVGHLGELPLAAASMATSFASITSLTLLKGMGSALETLCGQSYGAKQYSAIGIHLQRSLIVLLLAGVPLSLASAYAGEILLFLGQDPEISAEAGKYAMFVIPSIFGFAIMECHVRFLQSQNNVFPLMATTWIATLLHVLVCWLLVFKSGLGSRGAAIANGVAYWINGVSLFVYVRVSTTCKRSWTGWSREALNGIPEFLKLAVPSAIMLSLEIWSFEMLVLLAGLLPNPKLETSVLSIRGGFRIDRFEPVPSLHRPKSMNTCAIVYMLPLGLSATVSTRVSNELGGGRPRAALLAIYVSVAIVTTEAIVTATVMVLGHNVIGYLYSTEEEVVKYVGEMMLLSAAFHFFDGIQSVLSGICRGCGRQKVGAIANLGAYYLLGIPCSTVLAFVFHMGGKGLWIGNTIAVICQALFMTIMTVNTNWEKEARNAKDRVYSAITKEKSLLS